MKSEKIKKLCEENHIRMIDFKMTDIDGRWRHITIPVERFGENTFTQGIGFDGSNYGFAPVEKEKYLVTRNCEEDCTFFIKGAGMKVVEEEKLRIPSLAQA